MEKRNDGGGGGGRGRGRGGGGRGRGGGGGRGSERFTNLKLTFKGMFRRKTRELLDRCLFSNMYVVCN